MNRIVISLILSCIAGFGTVIGSLFTFLKVKDRNKLITFACSFSATVMILISIFDLIPPSIVTLIDNSNIWYLYAIISFVLGIILIRFIDKKIGEESSLKKVGILSFLSLIIHNFPEGIATFMASMVNPLLGVKLCIAIMLHNIPEGICIAVPITYSTHSIKAGVGMSLLSSLAEPLGAIVAYLFLSNYINEFTIAIVLIFVAGIMITLSINSIYKESLKYHRFKYFIYGILASLIYIIVSISI